MAPRSTESPPGEKLVSHDEKRKKEKRKEREEEVERVYANNNILRRRNKFARVEVDGDSERRG